MPDNNMIGFHWIILCYYGGRCEKVEADDDGVVRYLRDLLSNPRKTHPDIEAELTHVRVYKRAADIAISKEYEEGMAWKIDGMIKSLHVETRADEECTWRLSKSKVTR